MHVQAGYFGEDVESILYQLLVVIVLMFMHKSDLICIHISSIYYGKWKVEFKTTQ